jgi:hypothetical protein
MTFLRSMATARVDSVKPVVEHRLFGAFFTACILLNTLVLAMEFDGMSSAYESGLSAVNVALTVAFAAELLVKLLGLGITEYFRDAFNTFDALVVLISLVELLLADSGSLSALRSFRILRILKLIRSWRTLQKFLYTMYATGRVAGRVCVCRRARGVHLRAAGHADVRREDVRGERHLRR